MSDTNKAPYMLENVKVIYPRIDKPYRFDNKEDRTVPCGPLEGGANYQTGFIMSKEQAKPLFTEMVKAYNEAKKDSWPAKYEMPFTKNTDGTYTFKSTLKAAYDTELTRKPMQVDSKGTPLPDSFLLTNGSTVNLAFMFVPYHSPTIGTGTSLRLRAVQVIKLEPMVEYNPFGVVEGGFEQGEDNPFAASHDGTTPEKPTGNPVISDDLFGDDEATKVKEPKKVVKKTAPAPKASDDVLAGIVADWDD